MKFGTLPCIDGYDVIALDTGRQVAHRDSLASANGVAYDLNYAVLGGHKALAAALNRPAIRHRNPRDPRLTSLEFDSYEDQ